MEYIETLYDDLSVVNQKEKIDIKLPTKIIQLDFSLLVSFLQFISTWLRKENSGNLYLPLENDDSYESYLNQEFVYPVVVLCWEKSILDDNNNNLKSSLKKLSQRYYNKMEYLELKSHESIPIYCFDHDLSKRGFSRFLYELNKTVVSEDALDFNLYPVFEKIGNHFNRELFKKSIRPVIEDFAKITHELFLNTHEHARTDVNGFNLYPNIRSVYFKFHKRTLKNYRRDYQNNKGLLEYFDSDLPLNDKSELYLFEISVFDSGPGLVKRFERLNSLKNLKLDEEVEIIKKCLFKHNTSSVGINKENKGLGLNRVLETIDNKGFLRIKTGRVDVFRDLRNKRHTDAKLPTDILLFDWNNNSIEFTKHKEVEGTLISIIYPLGL
ncbi:hypothetical protein D9V96_014145 [Zobellia laminariae]|uniref:hypothetical protein n=1 Tax=Zobellia laminariae TaxID=248906 RepID=UPI0012D92C6D